MKTILYTTDYSENSAAALKYALKMSQQLGTRLVVGHVFSDIVILGMEGIDKPIPHVEKNFLKEHRTRLEEFCEFHLGKNWASPNLQLQAMENQSVLKGILSIAEEWHAYLIVVGMKGGSGLRELILGSTTKQLIEKAPCPVLAIPADAVYNPLKTIVYASDFEEEDVYAIRKLTEIGELYMSEIKIIHISTEDEYKGQMQLKWFKEILRKKVAYEHIEFKLLFSEDVFGSLQGYLDDVGADIMVMLEREEAGFLKKWFHRDLVKKMETHGKVPLLSFRGSNHQLFYFKEAL
ncbi:MAG: universal stress protein [Maribacter sp.]|nr:universal stress protein [Maribacter sp.]